MPKLSICAPCVPLDREAILTSLAKTNRLVIAEEGWPTCSIASEVMAICMEDGFDHLDAPGFARMR